MKIRENTVIVTGYIHQVFVNEDKTVMNFSLGVDESYYKDNNWVNKTSWVACKVFGKDRIERLESKLKEVEVLINGQIKGNSYEKDGKAVFDTYLLASRIQIISDKSSGNSDDSDSNEGINLSGIEDE